MPISYTIDRAQQIVRVVWHGVVDDDTVRNHVHRLLLDPEARALGRNLTDVRNARMELNGTGINSVVRQVIEPGLSGQRWRTGFVVSGPAQFGMVRQFEAYADGTVSVGIFEDVAEAERWVLSDSSD